MKRIIITIALASFSYIGYTQGVFGSDIYIKNNAGTRGYVYRIGNHLGVNDSTANVYNLAQKLKLDSLYSKINSTIAVTQSGTWNINNISGTISLPTGAATAAKQPDYGTAGTPSGDVITIQGRTSMFPIAIGATAIYDSTWTAVAMDTAGLGAKANSATVGWQSDSVGLRQHKATDMKVGVKISFANTAPANDKACYIYAVPWWYDGTNWYAGSQGTTTLPTGANGTTTIASPNDLVLLGVLSYTTQNQVCQRQFNLSNAFGQTMPDAVSFIVVNYTGAAIHTTNNLLYYSLVNKTQR